MQLNLSNLNASGMKGIICFEITVIIPPCLPWKKQNGNNDNAAEYFLHCSWYRGKESSDTDMQLRFVKKKGITEHQYYIS